MIIPWVVHGVEHVCRGEAWKEREREREGGERERESAHEANGTEPKTDADRGNDLPL